jgi:hypothetical protein
MQRTTNGEVTVMDTTDVQLLDIAQQIADFVSHVRTENPEATWSEIEQICVHRCKTQRDARMMRAFFKSVIAHS